MEKNVLYPVFLKLENLKLLIVGGGAVGLEKLMSIYQSSPVAQVTVLSIEFKLEIIELSEKWPNLKLITKPFDSKDVLGYDIVIAATCFVDLNTSVQKAAKAEKILCNVADTPDLCDFYMCSIVQKGDIKIGISTNGKSPTLAKRLRMFLTEVLPIEIDELAQNLNEYRNKLKGDFEDKVNKMNELTKDLLYKSKGQNKN